MCNFAKLLKIKHNMKAKVFIITAVLAVVTCIPGKAQNSNAKQPDMMESCELEADRLERLLDLEPWQTFRVDSTLKHNFPAMNDEMAELRKTRTTNTSMYQAIQDKWMDRVDASYKKIFTEEQWAAYLKQGAGRAQKARAKRQEAIDKATNRKK